MEAADLLRCHPADKFLHGAVVPANAYHRTKFQLPSSILILSCCILMRIKFIISYRDKKDVPKFPLPYPVRWNFHVCSKYLARSNSVPNFSIVSLCIMQLCEYVFSIGFPLYVPQNGVFEGEYVKILCSNPQKALPCVNTRLLVYRMSNRFNGLSSRSVERFCVQRNRENKNLDIANRSRVSCAHNSSRASLWPWNLR